LAGGHSINISDPIFGLAVNGIVSTDNIKQNSTASAGCHLFLTKPIGIGIVTTAEKKGVVKNDHRLKALELMTTLNKSGTEFAKLSHVKAMTDVTGFGLLGHLLEICEGSKLSADIYFNNIPQIEGVNEYISLKATPGGTLRNWKSYGEKISHVTEEQKMILCDPQTSGGLLVAVEKAGCNEFLALSASINQAIWEIGELNSVHEGNKTINIL
jgi:selenide, water dikinase